MSVTSDIKPVLTTDARISDIKSQLDVSALVGSRDNSFYSYSATTASANSVNINCALPSESVVFDRMIFIGAKVNFSLKITVPKGATGAPVTGTPMFEYGNRCAFQQFPLNGLIANNNVKVNSVSFNMSQDDLQGVLLRTQDLNELVKSNMCMSPSYPDQYLEYTTDQLGYENNPLKSYTSGHFSSLVSRGAHPLENVKYFIQKTDGTVVQAATEDPTLFVAKDPAADDYDYIVNFSARFFEPLLLSPFIFSSKKISKAGLVNVQNLTFNFSIDTLLRNVWSRLPYASTLESNASFKYTLQLSGDSKIAGANTKPFDDFNVFINCLTPHITEVLPPISILPCHTWERYISSAVNTSEIISKASSDVVLNNLVLSQIPEQIIIVVRKPMSSTSFKDAKSYFKINSCSINFLNSQGMLSNCNDNLLFKISKENGYADNWYQWSGVANSVVPVTVGGSVVGVYHNTIHTSGSVLIINPAKDLSIGSPYLTNGSRGNYNLQVKLNVTNYYSSNMTPEVMIACKNSCYLKNYPGGKSTLTSGYFDMATLSQIVTDKSELSNADLQEAQGNSLSDQSIGEVDPARKYEGAGIGRSYRGAGGRTGGMMTKDRSLKNKICL